MFGACMFVCTLYKTLRASSLSIQALPAQAQPGIWIARSMSPPAHGITRWRSIGATIGYSVRGYQTRSSRAIWPSCARQPAVNHFNGMSKLWGRKVADLGSGDFAITLAHHANKAGKTAVKYPRFSNSMGVCPLCRAKHKLQLWQRSFECCAILWDRDQGRRDNTRRGSMRSRARNRCKTRGRYLGQPALVTAGSQLENVGSVDQLASNPTRFSRGSATERCYRLGGWLRFVRLP
jgi:hypothetical protein